MDEREKKAIEVFYSYAPSDETLRNVLEKQLSSLKRQGLIIDWHDHKVIAGAQKSDETNNHLNTASIILLLISPDFINSDYCYSIEMTRAMERHISGEASVIPIILRPTHWKEMPFGKLRSLPSNGRPVTSWRNRDEAFLDIVKGIQKVVEEISFLKEALPRQSQQYCDAVYEHWRMLDFKGIMHVDMNRPISMPLTEVFVLPDVLSGVPEYETLEREDLNEEDAVNNGRQEIGEQYKWDPPTGRFTYQQLQKPVQTPEKSALLHREELQTVLARQQRLIILGDPGSGKSTLLRYIMLLLAQGGDAFYAAFPQLAGLSLTIPLYIPLASYAEACSSGTLGERSLKHFLTRYLSENYLDTYTNFIQHELERGNVFVLLDGLDEIPDVSLRIQIVRHVELFTQSFPKNRFLITSRIVGYREASLAAGYQAYTLADFNEKQIKIFMQQWCPAYERWVKGVTESHYLQLLATKEAEKMFRVIQRETAVKKLAVNPLLLTIIALIQRQGIELPSHRIELFDLCAMTLIDTWLKAKGGVKVTTFSKNNLIKLLCPLAFWMHGHPAVGAVPEEELTEQIIQQLLARKITRHEDEAIQLAEQFLDVVRGKTGILIERGKKRYGFLHLTFEEYFAARELEIREDRNNFIQAHLHDARWREVILLTIGSIGILHSDENGVTKVVQRAIMDANSRFETWLHRDLLFAGTCLADDIGISIEYEDDIIERIIYLYLTSPYSSMRRAIDDKVSFWSNTSLAAKTAKVLLFLLQKQGVDISLPVRSLGISSTEAYQLSQRIDAYSQNLIEQRQVIINDFVVILRSFRENRPVDILPHIKAILSFPDSETKQTSLRILEQLGQKRPEVIDIVLKLLSDSSWRVRQEAIKTLKRLKNGSREVIAALVACLSDPDSNVKQLAADTLGQLGQESWEVVAALLELLSDSNASVRRAAITTLGWLGQGNAVVIDTLLGILFDYDVDNRRVAVAALGQVGREHPKIERIMFGLLSDSDEQVRQTAAQILGKSGQIYPEIMQTMLELLSDPRWQRRQAGAIALGEIDSNNPVIIEALLNLLSDPDLTVRQTTISALGQVKHWQSDVVTALLKHLSNSSDLEIQAVVRALGQLGCRHSEVITALLKLLASHHPGVRQEAILALEQLGTGQPEIIDALLNQLTDPDVKNQQVIVQALGQLGQGSKRVIDALLRLLAESNMHVKPTIINVLSHIGEGHPTVAEVLLKLFSEADSETRRSIIGALVKIAQRHPEIINTWLPWSPDIGKVINKVLDDLADEDFETFKALFIALPDSHIMTLLSKESFAQEITDYQKTFGTQLIIRTIKLLKVINYVSPLVIEALVKLLSDSNWQIREETVQALEMLSQGFPEVISELIKLLSDSDWQVREAAVQALGKLGQGFPEAISELVKLLSDSNWQVREAAVQALGNLDHGSFEATGELIKLLSDSHPSIREAVLQVLAQIDQGDPKVSDAMLNLFSSSIYPDVNLKKVTEFLPLFVHEQQNMVNSLLKRLSDPGADWQLKWAAVCALGELGHDRSEVIDALLELLSDSSQTVKQAAAQTLGELGQGRPEVIDALLKLLSDSSQLVKQAAAQALGELGQGRPEVIDALLKLLSDPRRQIKQAAVQALGELGQGRPEVIDALLKLLSDSSSFLRQEAVQALERLGNGEARIITALLKLISIDSVRSSRQAAVNALTVLAVDRVAVAKNLEELLQDQEMINSKQVTADPVADSLLDALLKIVG